MTGRSWAYLGLGLALLTGAWLMVTRHSRPTPTSPPPSVIATGPTTPPPTGGASPLEAPTPVLPELDADLAEAVRPSAIDARRPETARDATAARGLTRDEPTRYEAVVTRLKRYQDLWVHPTAAKLHEAEVGVLPRLEALPPRELIALIREGLATSPLNLVLIALENALRGPRRAAYETALIMGMEEVFERPDKLELLSEVTLRSTPSAANAESAARLLMKREPSGRLAELLGGFASRLQGDPRREIKQFALEHNLVETLVWLVDDGADVARLEAFVRNPATGARVRQTLLSANAPAMNQEVRRRLQRALDSGSLPK